MKKLLLFTIFALQSIFIFGQNPVDLCGSVLQEDILTFPHTETVNLVAPAFGDEADYTATGLAGPIITAFYAFTVNANGNYDITFQASGVSPASGDLSTALDLTGTGCAAIATEDNIGDISTGFEYTCQPMVTGTVYYLAMALDQANGGEITITIQQSNDVCSVSADELFAGANLVNNNCGGSGLAWFQYTVLTGDDVILSTTDGTLTTESITQVWLNGCPATGTDITGDLTCLSPGDVLFIEAGDNTPNFGDWTINITEADNGVLNDDCVDAEDLGTLDCTVELSGAGDIDACPDIEATCQFGDDGVWYTFNVDASVVNTFSFTGGSEYEVFTGPDCNNLTTVDCDDGALANLTDITSTYWVLVYNTGSFTVESDTDVPANDDCASPDALVPGVEGYNTCATGNFAYCGFDASSHQVFYEYTNTNGNNVDLDITINGINTITGTAVSDVSAVVLSDCGGTVFPGFTEECNVLGTTFSIGCIGVNETIILVVGSPEGSEGDFRIGVVENISTVVNDNCDGAIDLGIINSSCTQQDNNADNTGACPDAQNDGGCNFDVVGLHGIWYTFTTDADAEFLDITTDLPNAQYALYTGADCSSLSFEAGSCTTGGADLVDFVVNPNTTYYLLITSDTESAFNIGITIKNIPDNELCIDAETLSNGLEGTNACATAWTSAFCGLDNTSHVVFYRYTNNTGSNVDINISFLGITSITGTAANDVSIVTIEDDCNNPVFYPGTDEECGLMDDDVDIECIEAGESIIIAVGSEDGEEGDFRMVITETNDSPVNDECDNAEVLNYTPCEWETFNGDNTGACPEDFIVGGCAFETDPVVWFTFTASADANTVEFDNITGPGAPFMAIFEFTADCDNQTLVAGSGCITGTDGPFNITGSNHYLIGFGTQFGEGAFSFDMRVNEFKENDDPCDPSFALTTLSVGDYIDDNSCAGPDFSFCAVDDTEGKTLFYEYTMTQDADLEINIAGNTAAGPFYIGAYENAIACGDESNFLTQNCADNTLIIPCLLAGDVIVIAIGTSENPGEYGEYTLTINENTPPRPNNDECTDAEFITYEDADLCTWVDVENNESNINACSEDSDFGSGCDYDTEEVVWFEFTAPNATDPGSQLSIQFLNYDGTGTLFATLFESSADCSNLTPLSACQNGLGPNNLGNVDPNTTYLIGVGSTGDSGGNFDMQINISSGPANDDPCEDLTGYDLTGVVTLTGQTNLCAGPDGAFPECTGTDQESAVIYTFTISDPFYGIAIGVDRNVDNGTPIQGTIVVGVSAVDDDFCTGTTYTPPAYCESIETADFEFICLEEGTYQLKVSSSVDNSGDFDITSRMLEKQTTCSESLDADLCEEAASNTITGLDPCQATIVAGCNNEACPEDFVFGAPCNYESAPVVWYSFTTLDDATSVDITNFSSAGGQGFMAIFESDCDNVTAITDCITDGNDETNIAIMPNTTYYIGVGNNNGTGGDFEFEITVNVPPENDDPCPSFPNPPIDLTGGGSHNGTTCCAVGFADDPTADYPNLDCGAATEENTVWYTLLYDGASYDGIQVNVDGDINGPATIEIYYGPDDGGCDGDLTFLESSCSPLPAEIRFGCVEDGQTVYIRVASTDDGCGDFTISTTELTDCEVADECEDISAAQVLTPVTDPNFTTIEYVCAEGCIDLACPEDPLPAGGNGCDFSQTPTVWYEVQTDDIAAQLFTTVTAAGTWEPMWSVYYGDDCDNLTNAASGATPPCSIDDDSPDLHQTGVEDLYDSYYVAVTANPNGPPVDNPNFEICAATIINVLVCLGEIDDNCEPDPSTEIMIVDREFSDLEPDVDPDVGYMGPFCPGEEVQVHIEFFYDATESSADWFIGLVPDFGPGWDMDIFDPTSEPPTGTGSNGGPGEWLEWDSECYANMEEPVPHLCTYLDDEGILRLCNALCENCSDCEEQGMQQDDILPSGYFWLTDGSNAACVNGSCISGEQWGIGAVTSQINWDFTLTVKEFATEQECLENNELQITFQTFSDGGAGCWEDATGECLIDRKQLGPYWYVECELPPGVVSTPQPREICTGDVVDISVATEDGSNLDIEVYAEDNPNVDGENDHVFSGGFGVIDDVLTLDDGLCQAQEVIYFAKAIDPNVNCAGKEDTIYVMVYPNPEIEQDEIPGDCFPSFNQYNLTDYLECEGYPGELFWNWELTDGPLTGITGNTSTIQFDGSFDPGIYTFTVTVTDELGCNSVDEVQFEVYPPVHFTMSDTTVCYDEPAFLICPEFDEPGTPEYDYLWSFDCFPTVDYGDCFLIEPEITVEDCPDENSWDLNLLVTDDNNCVFDTTITITINPAPEFTIDPLNPAFCEGQNEVEVCLTDIFAQVDYVEWIQPDGTSIESYVPFYCATLTQPGEHTVIMYDLIGCTTEYTFTVGQNTIEPPAIEPDTICVGESTTLTVIDDYDSYLWRNTGETTKSIVVSPPLTTTYTVDVTDANGCYATNDVTVTVLSTELPTLPDTASFCEGFSTQISAGAGYDEYHWYQGSTTGPEVGTTDTLVVTEEDWYYIEVFLQGCPALDSIFVQSDNELSPSVFGDFQLCFEEDSTLVIATGGAFIDYVWTDTDAGTIVDQGPSLDSIYLPEGNYELYVSDGSCAGTETFTIDKKPPVLVDIFPDVDTVDICYGTDTMLYATPGFVAYEWTKGGGTISVNDSLFNVVKGTYQVIVTDEDGCKGRDTIVVREFPPVLPDLGPDRDICATDIATLTPGTGFTTYTWYVDGVENTTWANEDSIFVNDSGEYVVAVTDAIGCYATDTVIVNKTDELMPVIVGNLVLCEGDVSTLSVQPIFDNYEWTNQAGNVLSTVDSVEVSQAGEYYILVYSDTGCEGYDTATVVVNIPPNAIVTDGQYTVCGQGSTTPGTLDFSSYVNPGSDPGDWSDTDGSGVIANGDWSVVDFSNVPAGTYTFTFTTNIAIPPCVEDSETITVLVETCLCDQFTIDPIRDYCNDETDIIFLNAYLNQPDGLPLNGTWTIVSGPGGTPLNGSQFDPTQALEGTYTLEFTLNTIGNFCWDTQTVDILISDAKEADVDDDPKQACGMDSSNGSSVLDFTEYINSTDAGDWEDTDGSGVITNGDWSSVDFSNVAPGAYSFTFTTTGANPPCQNVSDVLVVIVEECDCDILTINPIDTVCNEGSAIINLDDYLQSNPDGLPFDGNWSIASGPGDNPLNGSQFDPSLSTEGGTYTLTFTHNVQGNWCEASQSVELTIVRAPIVGVSNGTPEVCFGILWSGLQLESLIDGEDMGGTWTEVSDNPSIGGAFDPIAGTFNTIDQAVGTYSFEYSLAGDNYCGGKSIIVEVTINPLPTADAGEPKFGCFGDVVTVGGLSSQGPEYTYEWTDQDGQVVSTEATFEISQSGTFTLVVTNTSTGCIDQDVTEVEIFPDYSGTIQGLDLLIDGESDVLQLILSGLDISQVGSFVWYRNGDLIPGETADTLFIEEDGQYCVDIIPDGDEESACIVQVCKTVNTVLTKEVYIPNIFSPNGDGENDIFTVEGGKNIERINNVSVYDRWGELVFVSGTFTLDKKYDFGWDGRFKDQAAVQGVYVYVVDVLYNDETSETVSGDITLIR